VQPGKRSGDAGSLILANPGVFVFPKVSVCLDCGSSRFSIAETELALLAFPKEVANTRTTTD